MTTSPTTRSATPNIVDRDAWLAARRVHLDEEKAFTRQRDELSRKRRELPWTEVAADYVFDGPDGRRRLIDLFDGHGQLCVYHFMMGPDQSEGCPSCSFWADNYDGTMAHLAARDTAFVTVARAPLTNIEAYREQMGWSFPWYSSLDSEFNFDMGVSARPEHLADGSAQYNFGTQAAFAEEMPGLSVFNRGDDGRVFLSYQTFARGLDMLNATYHHLDLTPKGRDEDDLDFTMAWLHRHDAYPS